MTMTDDSWVVAGAAALWLGAWAGLGFGLDAPARLALVVAAAGLARPGSGRPMPWTRLGALCLLGFALAAGGHRAEPPPPANVDEVVTLLADPEAFGRSARADAASSIGRVEVVADGSLAPGLGRRAMGEEVRVAGRFRSTAADEPWLQRRGVVGVVTLDRLDWWRTGRPVTRVANGLRRRLIDGAASLDPQQRALFTGFVLGDDRGQSAKVADDFRGAGLGHLLVVSGQNVAFVLALAAPALARLGTRSRWVATVGVIAFFALLTRFEPSVLRASAMAGLAATAVAVGRSASGLRLLAVAVGGIVVVRPTLVTSVAFQLSVAASLGILVLSPVVSRWLPGPAALTNPIAVTVGAQLAVTPLLIARFGGVPVASIPANLLAGPAAAPITVWGLSGGLVAGVVGEPFAGWIHTPTGWLIAWVQLVASVAARSSLGEVGPAQLVGFALAVAAGRWLGDRRRWARHLVVVVAAGAVLGPAAGLHRPPPMAELAPGVTAWRSNGVVVVALGADVREASALAGLRGMGVGHIDLLVATAAGPGSWRTLQALDDRYAARRTIVPVALARSGATTVGAGGLVWSAGGLHVTISPAEGESNGELPRAVEVAVIELATVPP